MKVIKVFRGGLGLVKVIGVFWGGLGLMKVIGVFWGTVVSASQGYKGHSLWLTSKIS